ncbi:glycosyltransferase family 4 protein [Polynucleobacter paneuropaeus]|uniref:Glycosyltransferase family 4 protein n=1 Tax=Polynucleobacter paneuropaeus TaxID=2527775 RepID=A0A9Q2WKA9_9BURK|nr:glycosyltransferase family 4 protein [Polynucleobacter paneuropaeus]
MTQKILLTTPTFPPDNSGLGNAVQQMAKLIADQGWEVVVATGGATRCQSIDPLSGAVIEQFNVGGADSMAQPLTGDVDSYVQFLKNSTFNLVVMNAWQIWSTDLVLAYCKEIPGKKILYSHCISANSFVGKYTLRSFIRYLAWRPYWLSMPNKISKLDGLIFLADRGCDARFDDLKLARRLGVDQIVIPNSLSLAAFSVLERPKVNFMKRSGILSIGAYDWQKGHDFVLKTYALSDAKNKVQLHFYGQKYSPFTDSLRDMAAHLELDPNYVHFHEGLSQDALMDKYTNSSVFLYGSHTECQPLVLLDAMAAGTPFISRASGSIPYMSGGVVASSEIDAAKTLNLLLKNQEDWEKISNAGRHEALERHSPDSVKRAILRTLLKFQD